jgi:fatty-acyl-CoA synthase
MRLGSPLFFNAALRTKQPHSLVFTRGNATNTTANNSHIKREGKTPLVPGGPNFGTYLTERAQKFEHKDLFIIPSEDVRNTFLEVRKAVDAYAAGFRDGFLKEGNTFVGAIPDVSFNLWLQLGAARSNVAYIPFSPNVPLKTFMGTLKSTKARGFVVPDFHGNREWYVELYEQIPELDLQLKDSSTVFRSLEYPQLVSFACCVWSKEKKEYHGYNDVNNLCVTHPPRDPVPTMVSLTSDKPTLFLPQDDTATFDALTPITITNTGSALLEALSVNISDRISLSTSLNSIGYFVAAGCISHASVLVQALNPKYSPEATLKTIGRDRCTMLFINGDKLAPLLNHPELPRTDLSTLRTVVVVGPLDDSVIAQAKKLGAKEVFGVEHLDGHTGQLTGLLLTGAGKARPLPATEVKIVDGQGNVVPIGTKGTIHTKGSHVLEAFGKQGNGWLNTKRQGQLSADGVVTLH